MRSGIPWIALWLGALAGGAVSPVAVRAQEAPAAQPAPQGTAEPVPQTADLSITARGGVKGMPAVGGLVPYTLVVANAGPSEANRAQVSLAPDTPNIGIDHVSGACDALPCYLPPLAPGAHQNITVNLRIASGGSFGFTARVRGVEPDPDQTNNAAMVSVTPPALAPTRAPELQSRPVPSGCADCGPPPWWLAWLTPWTLGGGALLLLLLLAVGGTTIMRRRRRARWLERLTVTAGPGAEASVATGPIALAGPVLTLSIRCEPGKAGPLGPVQILGVTYDD